MAYNAQTSRPKRERPPGAFARLAAEFSTIEASGTTDGARGSTTPFRPRRSAKIPSLFRPRGGRYTTAERVDDLFCRGFLHRAITLR